MSAHMRLSMAYTAMVFFRRAGWPGEKNMPAVMLAVHPPVWGCVSPCLAAPCWGTRGGWWGGGARGARHAWGRWARYGVWRMALPPGVGQACPTVCWATRLGPATVMPSLGLRHPLYHQPRQPLKAGDDTILVNHHPSYVVGECAGKEKRPWLWQARCRHTDETRGGIEQ